MRWEEGNVMRWKRSSGDRVKQNSEDGKNGFGESINLVGISHYAMTIILIFRST